MHPALAAFPNTRFYAGRLVDGVQAHQRPPPKGLRFPVRDTPIVMLDVQGQEVREVCILLCHVCLSVITC